MVQLKLSKKEEVKNRISSQGGLYSITMTVIVLAILIAVNILVSALPTTLTKFDMSATKLYSITSDTKVVVNNMEKDVTIYWIVQAGEEDDVIENLLGKYESLSSHIEVVKKNPDVYPTFAEKYTSDTVYNNSLVVECGDQYRYIGYEEIYLSETDYYTYETSYYFDGEGALTSAIDYVVSDDIPVVYLLEGHGEAELPSTLSNQINKANIITNTFSILQTETIPEDAAAVMIYAPTSDISEEERDVLADYIENEGKLMVIAGPTEDGILTNLYSLLETYGLEPVEGIVIEEDSDYYALGYPYLLLPSMSSSDITDDLIDANYYVLLPIATGLRDLGTGTGTVNAFLSTSSTAFSKVAGYDLTTYEKEENDIDGTFTLGVSIETNGEGKLVWFTSSDFMEDQINSYSSGANVEIGMKALSSLIGEREAIAISSKSLDYNYLTISESTGAMLKVVMIGVCPIVYLGIGIIIVVRRRQGNEAS